MVPKALRDALGLQPGQELDATVRDGRLEVAPLPVRVRLEDRHGGLVAVPERPVPPLDTQTVRDVLENVRR